MAQKVQTLFIDDLDGSAAEGTVRFGLDDTEYEIDLNAACPGTAGCASLWGSRTRPPVLTLASMRLARTR